MSRWHSLYWSSDATPRTHIESFLEAKNFTRYNPFGTTPSLVYPRTLKTFIAPAQSGWTRILVDADRDDANALAAHLSRVADCLSFALDNRVAFLRVFHASELVDLEAGLSPHVIPEKISYFKYVLHNDELNLPPLDETTRIGSLSLDELPPDLQAMKDQISAKQADNMFERLSRRFLKAVSPRNLNAFMNTRPDWESQGGQLIRALVACLPFADTNWRTPDFATLRSAYLLQTQRETNPNLTRLPGDDLMLKAVPDALAYSPVYGGKSESA